MKFSCHSSISIYVIKCIDIVVAGVPSCYTSMTIVAVVPLLMYEVDRIVNLKSKDKYHSDALLKNSGITIKICSPSGRLLDYFNI